MTDQTDGAKRRDRYEAAFSAGVAWATKELEAAGDLNATDDVEGMVDEAIAAYTALQTGRMPSLVGDVDDQLAQVDIGEGFYGGAGEVLDRRRQSHPFEPPDSTDPRRKPTRQREGRPDWSMNDDSTGGSINLTVEIEVEKPLLEECVAQAVHSLRDVAARIEGGEGEGPILDQNGQQIGSFDLFPAEQG